MAPCLAAGDRPRRSVSLSIDVATTRERSALRLTTPAGTPSSERSSEIHREETLVVLDDEVAQAHEVWMMHVLHRAKFALQLGQRLGGHAAQCLERDARPTLAVQRFVDHSIRALPQAAKPLETS